MLVATVDELLLRVVAELAGDLLEADFYGGDGGEGGAGAALTLHLHTRHQASTRNYYYLFYKDIKITRPKKCRNFRSIETIFKNKRSINQRRLTRPKCKLKFFSCKASLSLLRSYHP